MARYDRIARIAPPSRDDAFTGWLAVRDLAGRERDAELGRRARLRFLAVRLLHRLAAKGAEIDQDSLRQQCDAVREELGQLPSRDGERRRLAELLKHAASRDEPEIVRAAFDFAEAVDPAEHRFAAEELYRVGVQLADANDLPALREEGMRRLAELDTPQA